MPQPSTRVTLIDPQKLVDAMAAASKSVRVTALEADISSARVNQLMRGHVPQVGLESAQRIAAALDVEVRSLFSYPDGPTLVRLGLVTA